MLSSCSVKYVAEYDEGTFREIINVSKKVDVFFLTILETPVDHRNYNRFRDSYIIIEADLNSLFMRNEIREFNEETLKQIKETIKLWQDDKAKHKKKNTVKNFIAKKHKEQFHRVFIAMAKAEMAKDIK